MADIELSSQSDPLAAWPNRAAAADILGEPRSRLTYLESEELHGEPRYRPRAVLEAAASRDLTLNSIAAKLIEHAQRNVEADVVQQLREEIDQFFADRARRLPDPDRFLRDARRLLPEPLYEDAKDYLAAGAREGGGTEGDETAACPTPPLEAHPDPSRNR